MKSYAWKARLLLGALLVLGVGWLDATAQHSEQGNTPPPLESNKDCLVYCIEQYEQDILDGVPHAKAFEWYLRCWRTNCADPPMGFEEWRGPGGGTVYIIWVDEHSEQGHTVQDEPVSAADPIDWREKWRRPRWVLPFPWLWRRGPFGCPPFVVA